MIDQEGYLKIIDFGISIRLQSGKEGVSPSNESALGTTFYLAPEMVREGSGYGKAIDWWAVGIILYEMKFGEVPFDGESSYEIMVRILRNGLYFPGRDTGEIDDIEYSDEIMDLICRLLEKDENNRLGT